jgi:hypothetical protein
MSIKRLVPDIISQRMGREQEVLHRISGLRCRDEHGLGIDVRLTAKSDSSDYGHAKERKSDATAKHVDRGREC